jgi:hypothetical protein
MNNFVSAFDPRSICCLTTAIRRLSHKKHKKLKEALNIGSPLMQEAILF